MIRLNRAGQFLDIRAPKDGVLLATPEEIIGKTLYDYLPVDLATKWTRCIERALESAEIQYIEYALDIRGEVHEREARFPRMRARALGRLKLVAGSSA